MWMRIIYHRKGRKWGLRTSVTYWQGRPRKKVRPGAKLSCRASKHENVHLLARMNCRPMMGKRFVKWIRIRHSTWISQKNVDHAGLRGGLCTRTVSTPSGRPYIVYWGPVIELWIERGMFWWHDENNSTTMHQKDGWIWIIHLYIAGWLKRFVHSTLFTKPFLFWKALFSVTNRRILDRGSKC